jgi:hypothetical protein
MLRRATPSITAKSIEISSGREKALLSALQSAKKRRLTESDDYRHKEGKEATP